MKGMWGNVKKGFCERIGMQGKIRGSWRKDGREGKVRGPWRKNGSVGKGKSASEKGWE